MSLGCHSALMLLFLFLLMLFFWIKGNKRQETDDEEKRLSLYLRYFFILQIMSEGLKPSRLNSGIHSLEKLPTTTPPD